MYRRTRIQRISVLYRMVRTYRDPLENPDPTDPFTGGSRSSGSVRRRTRTDISIHRTRRIPVHRRTDPYSWIISQTISCWLSRVHDFSSCRIHAIPESNSTSLNFNSRQKDCYLHFSTLPAALIVIIAWYLLTLNLLFFIQLLAL